MKAFDEGHRPGLLTTDCIDLPEWMSTITGFAPYTLLRANVTLVRIATLVAHSLARVKGTLEHEGTMPNVQPTNMQAGEY